MESDELFAEVPNRAEVDPKILAEVGNLVLRARIVADSVLHGMHRSRHHGSSVEFAEHKEYSPGDNVRHLDWRAFARLDRDFIKRFEDESHLRALLVVDRSASMGYQSAEPRLTKLEYAKTCAGALAYVLSRQGDAVGLATFGDKMELILPARARRGHLPELLASLERIEPSGKTALAPSIDALAEGLTRRMLVIVISDLLDAGPGALEAIARISARRHDTVLLHLLDPDEIDFPFEDSTLFVGLEDGREVAVDPNTIRKAYREEIDRFLAQVEASALSARVEYHRVRTDKAPGPLLARLLSRRATSRATAR